MSAPLLPLVPLGGDGASCEGGVCGLPGAVPESLPESGQGEASPAPDDGASDGPRPD